MNIDLQSGQNSIIVTKNLPLSVKEWSLLTHIVRTYDVDTAIEVYKDFHSSKRKRSELSTESFQENIRRSKLTPSLLSINQRTLVSDILRIYHQSNAIPIVRNLLAKQVSSLPKLRFKSKFTLEIIHQFWLSSSSFTTFLSHVLIEESYRDQFMQTNFHTLTYLNGLFIGRQTSLLHHQTHSMNFQRIFSEDFLLITHRLISQLESNDILWILFLVVLAFSTRLSIVSFMHIEERKMEIDPLELNRYENLFLDLLWKYMLDRYDFFECINRFSRMVKIVLDLLDQLFQIERSTHSDWIKTLIEKKNHSAKKETK